MEGDLLADRACPTIRVHPASLCEKKTGKDCKNRQVLRKPKKSKCLFALHSPGGSDRRPPAFQAASVRGVSVANTMSCYASQSRAGKFAATF